MSLRWTWSERNLTSASWSWKLRSPANVLAKWTCQSLGRIKALCRAWVSKLYRAVKWVLQRSIMIWVINVLVEDHLWILSHAIHTCKQTTYKLFILQKKEFIRLNEVILTLCKDVDAARKDAYEAQSLVRTKLTSLIYLLLYINENIKAEWSNAVQYQNLV